MPRIRITNGIGIELELCLALDLSSMETHNVGDGERNRRCLDLIVERERFMDTYASDAEIGTAQ